MALPFTKSYYYNDSHDNTPDDDVEATATTPLLVRMTDIVISPSSRVNSSSQDCHETDIKKKEKTPLYYYLPEKHWWSYYTFFILLAFVLMMMTLLLLFVVMGIFLHMGKENDDLLALLTTSNHHHHHHPATSSSSSGNDHPAFSSCGEIETDCFLHIEPAQVQVPRNQPGFPSFWNYYASSVNHHQQQAQRHHQHHQPLHVTYDARSMMINGDRVLFLGGSLHPVRATPVTWELALDQAVHNGLNLITIYVFWSSHQPFPNNSSTLDWSFFSASTSSSSSWQLADAIRSCASRGLFVHLRIGPYACAEYTFGGIPEWLPLQYPQMQMRRLEPNWLISMEGFLKATIDYIKANRLWAYQGGPIIMAQVENELGGDMGDFMQTSNADDNDDDDTDDTTKTAHQRRHYFKPPTVQDYADWCGETVAKLSRNSDNGEYNIVWTMCNGLSANNTISTFNGDWLANRWLEQHGDTGRIQVDQPALWTEDEGGFQLWGEDSAHPSDYFWGNTARTMSKNALQWFARGGTHLNYYMWWGGYNRGRWAAAGMLNAYATDAVLCPSGEARQPKFGHFQALHVALAEIAPILLHAPSALFKNQTVQVMDDDNHGQWHVGKNQRMFVYRGRRRDVIFVENDQDTAVTIAVPAKNFSVNGPATIVVVEMKPSSSILMIDGVVRYDSGSIQPQAMTFTRRKIQNPVMLLNWTTWKEPVGATTNQDSQWVHTGTRPIEQTTLNIMKDKVWSDYAWYSTTFTLEEDDEDDLKMLRVDTDKANGVVAFLNGSYVDAADNHEHSEGNISLYLSLGGHPLQRGTYELALLSESLGYFNLVGRWIKNTGAKCKGITGDVVLFSPTKLDRNVSLVDGHRLWKSFAGLHVERQAVIQEASSSPSPPTIRREHLQKTLEEIATTTTADASAKTATWSAANFKTPRYDPSRQQLFLHTTTGRGHLWLNGHDLGRYWNITRVGREGETIHRFSQEYYFLPHDYLYNTGTSNDIIFFDVFGGNHRESELVLSWIEASSGEDGFKDEVDFPGACLL